MIKEDRHLIILELLRQQGAVKTSELCQLFNTTRQTIHNDLETLDQEGKLKKVYGGAVPLSKSDEPPIETRRVLNRADKNFIGKLAASFVSHNDTIFLDVSTTVNAMIPYLREVKNLTIITHSIEAAYLLGDVPDIRMFMVGGQVRPHDYATGGHAAIETLEDIFVDKAFYGAGGVSLKAGLTDYHLSDSQIRQVMIKNSNQNFVLFDRSKLNSITIAKFADPEDVDYLISYDIEDQDFLTTIENLDVSFLDAKDSGTN